jgi:phosphoribosylformimino-5-aminoimidazole carboxamide ribotide isomerase
MRVLPVVDLLNGVAVHGMAGKRATYRPVQSRLAQGAEPLELARAFRDQCHLTTCYVADLDAILHGRPNLRLFEQLRGEGFGLLIDAGVRRLADAREIVSAGAQLVIVGLETSPGPESVREIVDELGPERVVFSLDLQRGEPLTLAGSGWEFLGAREIVDRVVELGIESVILLDLAGVGMGAGIPTAALCEELHRDLPGLRLITGGGVRNVGDLEREARRGVAAVLVASALHDGRLTPADVFPFSQGWPATAIGNSVSGSRDRSIGR